MLTAGRWWLTPLIPALGRQRQADSEFEASLVYRVSSRTAKAIQRNSVSETKQNKTTTTNQKKPTKQATNKQKNIAMAQSLPRRSHTVTAIAAGLLFFLLGVFLVYIFNAIPKVPHTHPPPFLALVFPCTGAYKVCKSNGPLFPVMAD